MIGPLLAQLALQAAIAQAAPLAQAMLDDPQMRKRLTPASAMEHALGALAAETPDVPAEVLLALAWRESHMNPLSAPVGKWPVAPRTPPMKSWFICGVTQVTVDPVPSRKRRPTTEERAAAWKRCAELRDPFEAYAETIPQLEAWARICRSKYGRPGLRCVINAFSEGGRAGARGYGVRCRGASETCDRSAIVMQRAARLRRAVERSQYVRRERPAT